MSTTDQHPLVRLVNVGGGLIPLVALAVILWGIPWATAHGVGLLAWVIATVLVLLSGVLVAVRADQLSE